MIISIPYENKYIYEFEVILLKLIILYILDCLIKY